VFIETAVGQRWWEALILRIVHGQVAIGLGRLRNFRKLTGHEGLAGDADRHADAGRMGCPGDHLQPVTRYLVTGAADQDTAILRLILTDVDRIARPTSGHPDKAQTHKAAANRANLFERHEMSPLCSAKASALTVAQSLNEFKADTNFNRGFRRASQQTKQIDLKSKPSKRQRVTRRAFKYWTRVRTGSAIDRRTLLKGRFSAYCSESRSKPDFFGGARVFIRYMPSTRVGDAKATTGLFFQTHGHVHHDLKYFAQ